MKTPMLFSLIATLMLMAAPIQAAAPPDSIKIAQATSPGSNAPGTAGNTVPAGTPTAPGTGASATLPQSASQKAVAPPVSNNTQIDIHPPADAGSKAAPPPVTTNTRVEVQNQPPAANPPANVNIRMPDVNVAAPASTAPKETVTEHTTVITEKAPEPPQNDNNMYLAIIGTLALLVVVGFAIVMMRRNSSDINA